MLSYVFGTIALYSNLIIYVMNVFFQLLNLHFALTIVTILNIDKPVKIPIPLLTTSNTVDERFGIQVCKSSKPNELRKRMLNKAMPFVLVDTVIRSKMVNIQK